jgi:hypothetical protein
VNIDPEMSDRSRVIGFSVAYVTFILSYGLIIARFSLWGLLFGWLPAAAGAVVAGYVFYRSPLLCLILETIFVALHSGREQGLTSRSIRMRTALKASLRLMATRTTLLGLTREARLSREG